MDFLYKIPEEKKTSFSINKYVTKYSINDKPLIGFSKVAFSITDINSFYKKLKEKNVTFLSITLSHQCFP